MDHAVTKKSKRKRACKTKGSDRNKEPASVKPVGNNQTEKDKTEIPEISQNKSSSANNLIKEPNKDDGDSQTSEKINTTSIIKTEAPHKVENISDSCVSKTSKDDKLIDNTDSKACSQATPSNGATAGGSKVVDVRQTTATEAGQMKKIKSDSASASQTKKVNNIQSLLREAEQSGKVDETDQHFGRGRQWSSMRATDSWQAKNRDAGQRNAGGYAKRTHSAEKSLDPAFHSAYFHLSGRRENFHFFFRKQSPFSQHFMSKFEVNEVEYNCCEQFMMQQKALTFNDKESAKKIMATTEPNVQKRLGRQVKDFDGEVWNNISKEVVKKGNMAKFSQNQKLKEILLKTGKKVLVEASPYDKIWGIGLGQDDADAPFPEHWPGENRLGKVLMEVRDELSKKSKPE